MAEMIERVAKEIAFADGEDFYEDAKRFRALANAAIAAMPSPWQAIETCPTDGRSIIAFGGRFDVPTPTQADGDWWNSTVAKAMQGRPSHWMPIPDPPPSA